ncbi:MAG TPA: DUF3667 domain-containing protein [Allosphingosinicella sp.]|jgi:hypothetical protein
MSSGGIEAVGDAVTGGVLARAIEPRAGEGQSDPEGDEGGACLNCGTDLIGPHCHQCGQAAHVHRSLAAFWHDLAHGVLHFEGKIWRTLPLLAWRPGELTRGYVEGQRARFVSPIALFLFSVFVMFAVFNLIGGPVGDTGRHSPAAQASQAQNGRQQAVKGIERLQAERAAAIRAKRPTAALDAKIMDLRQQIGTLNTLEGKPVATDGGDFIDIDTSGLGAVDTAYKRAKENPSLLFYKLQTNAYKLSWALIPISVPFVWLMFLHRRRYRAYKAYDHTVFVTYSLCFMTLLVVVLSLLHALGVRSGWSMLALTLLPPVHMYRQLRGAYRLERWSAVWRTVLLLIFAGTALTLFLLLLVALGIAH